MKILIVDVDSKIPNLALMKIANYEKNNQITFEKLNISYYKNDFKTINVCGFDRVYISAIFPTSVKKIKIINEGLFVKDTEIITGGTGFDINSKLPENIENLDPLYELYPDCDYSIGFISRGCIRNCYFCYVPKKEGYIKQVSDPEKIIKHKKVMFLDNNFFALDNHLDIMEYLIKNKIKCCFKQGLDLRLLNEENAKKLSELKYWGDYMFAYDDIKLKKVIEKKTKILKKYITKKDKIKYYIYINPKMSVKNDILLRINFCKKNEILPYIMRDITCFTDYRKDFYKNLSAYCNQPAFFKKVTFSQILDLRDKKNKDFCLNIYNS